MRFLDLMEAGTDQKNKAESNSSFINMLHHFGNFVASIDDAKSDSEMYVDALANKKEPEELLQLALDFIRCMYEPNPVGTWLLNGNPDFFDDVISSNNNDVCYSSSSLSCDDNLDNHITETVIPSLEYQDYIPSNNQTIYTVITTHNSNLNTKFVENISSVMTDAFGDGDNVIHIGYCRDGALVDPVRVSVMVVS